MDYRRDWIYTKEKLVTAIKELGFPAELGEQIAKQLRTIFIFTGITLVVSE